MRKGSQFLPQNPSPRPEGKGSSALEAVEGLGQPCPPVPRGCPGVFLPSCCRCGFMAVCTRCELRRGGGGTPGGGGNVLGGFALQIGAQTSNKSRQQLSGSRACGGDNPGAQQRPHSRDPAGWGDPTPVLLQVPEGGAPPAIGSSQRSAEGRRNRVLLVCQTRQQQGPGVSQGSSSLSLSPAGLSQLLLLFITLPQAQHQEPNLE